MQLSKLQQFILREAYVISGRVDRDVFLRYYKTVKNAPAKELQAKIISKSLLRLIDRGLMIGHGRRTSEKWFIETIILTKKGRKQTQSLFGQQQVLPLTKGKRKKV